MVVKALGVVEKAVATEKLTRLLSLDSSDVTAQAISAHHAAEEVAELALAHQIKTFDDLAAGDLK